MKKSIIFICLFAVLGAAASNAPVVNEKVLKAFNETFTNATDVVWHELQNAYEARFTASEINSRATFDKDGNLLSTIRYYFENNLPTNILIKLKKKFEGKTVHGVTEITVGDDITYFIHLVDEKNWYTVRSDGWGNFEVTEKFKKA